MCLDEKSFLTTRVCILSSKKIPEGVRLAVDRVLVLILVLEYYSSANS